MTQQSITGGVKIPDFSAVSSISGVANKQINNGTDAVAMVFRFPKAGDIKKVGITTAAVTTVPTNGVLFQFETVDQTTGYPTGTLIHANATMTAASLTANSFQWKEFATAFTVTRGMEAALCVRCANTADTTDFRIVYAMYNTSNFLAFPYTAECEAGTWSKSTTLTTPILALEYSDGSKDYVEGSFITTVSIASVSFDNADTPAKRGNKYTLPFPCTVSGVHIRGNFSAGGSYKAVLYDSAANELATSPVMDGDVVLTNSGTVVTSIFMPFTTAVALSKDTAYYVMLEPQDGTNNLTIHQFSLPAAADMGGATLGTRVYSASLSGTTFTDTATSRYLISLFVTGFDDGTATGGTGGGSWAY